MYWMFLEPNKEFYIDTIFYDLPYVQSDIFDAKIRKKNFLFCFFEICLFTFTDFRTRTLAVVFCAHFWEIRTFDWLSMKSKQISSNQILRNHSETVLNTAQFITKTKNKKFATNPEEIFTCELWYVRNLQTTSDRTSTNRVSRLRSANSRTEAALKTASSFIMFVVSSVKVSGSSGFTFHCKIYIS